MADLPSFRPRGLIGRVNRDGGVSPDQGFLQWLDLVLRRTNAQENQRPPTGTLICTLASAEPDDGEWKLCDGQSLSVSDYPDLFAVIGYTFGGAGASFSLPNAQDLIMMGAGGAASLMGTAGALTQTLTTANMPAHSHGITDPGHTHTFTGTPHNHTVTDPGHDHTVTDPGHTHSVDEAAGAADAATGADVTSATGGGTSGSATTGVTVDSASTGVTVGNATAGGTNSTATTGITVNSAGSGNAFSILPPVLGVNWLIKT
ncbi:tail fiber protein [Leisingera sp. SS27]|uniref:phage tail protein n=1 Tax=Leisingera sp. SS27 TaxID=2979462 RepID=UPI00232D8824|nr:tail fiber protein [Leisingera sp. SS27]MDC0657047.1 tail fiber protein [Leisingera sp. SS27]